MMTERIELPRFQVLLDESYGTSEESSRVVTPRAEPMSTTVGSVLGGVLNLSAAAVGVGIVALPYAFSLIGIGAGVVCVCVIGCLTGITLYWLLECSQLSRKTTFEGNVNFFLGSVGYKFFSANLILLLLGGCVAMLMVSVSTLRGIWDHAIVDVVVVVLILGLCLVVIEDPSNRLGFASFFSLACVVYICGLLGLQVMNTTHDQSYCAEEDKGLLSITNMVSSISIVLNSFIMNFIFFDVVSSIPRSPTLPVKIRKIVTLAIGLIIVPLYIFISVAGIYGLDECGNFPSNIFVSERWTISPILLDSGRLALGFVNIFKFPLLILPLCHTIFPRADENRRVQVIALFPVVVCASYLFGDISQILNWMGTTCGISLGFIIPALMFYRLQDIEAEQADLAERIMTYHQSLPDTDPVTPSARRRAKNRTWKKWACVSLMTCSLAYAVVGIIIDLTNRGETLYTYVRIQ